MQNELHRRMRSSILWRTIESENSASEASRDGLTDRSYRRHKERAAQIVECQATQDRSPNVRAGEVSDLATTLPDIRATDSGLPSDSTISIETATQVAKPLPREAG